MRFSSLSLSLQVVYFVLISLLDAASVAKKPNFVYFLVDDLGYNDIGYHDSTVKSPTIDKLASEGMILENNYVAPVCSPSRGSLLTGKYAFNIGQQHGVFKPNTPACLTKENPLLQEALQDLGYKTYMLGKWHEGFCNISCTPNHRGFDEFYGFYNSHITHFTHLRDSFYDFRDNEEVDFASYGQYAASLLGERAVKNIEDHAASDANKPLFMYFSFPTVHTPIEAPFDYLQRHTDEPNFERRSLKAMISVTDDVIASVVQALKDNGMYENTVIIFSSDNGGEAGYSSNHPLRGAKASSWEGGVRVPGFIHSPLMKESAGTVSKELFQQTDWYATMMALAGGEDKDYLDGMDQTELLFNGGESARDVVPIHFDQYFAPIFGKGAIRSGKWKLIKGFPGVWNGYDKIFQTHESSDLLAHSDASASSLVFGTYNFDFGAIAQYTVAKQDSVLLFDLEADPTETTDLSADHPDVVAQLEALLQGYADQAVALNPDSLLTSAAANPQNFNGAWSPGWC